MNSETQPAFDLVLNARELEALAAERPERTSEIFTPNDFYGDAAVLKRYCGLPDDFIIQGILPHGPNISTQIWEVELEHPLQNVFVLSRDQRALYARQGKRPVIIGSPLLYAARLLAPELTRIRRHARGTIALPAHSTHHLTSRFDESHFIRSLKALPPVFHPVRICLYWKDIQLGRHRTYLDAGFQCTTAGHIFDKDFLYRMVRILCAHKYAVMNKLGSSALYAAGLGLTVKRIEQPTSLSADESKFLGEACTRFDLDLASQFEASARTADAKPNPVQRHLAQEALGADHLLAPEKLRQLFLAASIRPRPAPAPARDPGPVPQGSLGDILEELSRTLTSYPRRQPGRLKLEGRPFYYADLHSFYHQARQIFLERLYDFETSRDTPLILDCGAHIGLASLFFAQKFPRAVIHAFEADPDIALLAEANIRSLEATNVQIHAKAVWSHDQGVRFHRSADDSGFVTGTSGATVPSIRLRDWLRDRNVELLKLDIEGAEYTVLEDCDGALDHVRCLILEVHRFRDEDGALGSLLSLLERNHLDYTLGDLHTATWLPKPPATPFPARSHPKYVISVFAWHAPRNRRALAKRNVTSVPRNRVGRGGHDLRLETPEAFRERRQTRDHQAQDLETASGLIKPQSTASSSAAA